MRIVTLTALVLLGLAASPTEAAGKNRHERFIKNYEGTQTCLKCHEEEAENFFHTQHYQWRGATPDLVNAGGQELGKLSMVNDFCTNPTGPQWIGKVKNADGKVLAKGCSACHSGLGKLPSQEISREQLENMDCLICHASGYRRDLYATEDGGWEWRPILWKNQEGHELRRPTDPDSGSDDVSALPLRLRRRAQLQARRHRVHAQGSATQFRRAHGVGRQGYVVR